MPPSVFLHSLRARPWEMVLTQLYRSASAGQGPLASGGVLPLQQKRELSTGKQKLPKLPVPDPERTLKHFLDFAEAIESPKEYKETVKIVKKFSEEEVPRLQKLLVERAGKHNNWLTPWWLNVAYLEGRTPLPVVTSPGVCFPKFDFNTIAGQVEYAAKITQATLFFYKNILDGKLAEDKAGSAPLDMGQYKFLFGTTRLPGSEKDAIRYGCVLSPPSRHIVISRNGNFFQVDVFNEKGEVLPLDSLQKAFKQVVSSSEERVVSPVSVMTSRKRPAWAEVYESLKKDITNAASLECIERALVVVCLDGPSLPPRGYSDKDEQARQMIHGGGSSNNSVNRWFDKTIQLVIGANGYCGLTYEHTPAEGPPIGALMDFVMDQFDRHTFMAGCGDGACPPVRLLEFKLNQTQLQKIEKAKRKLDDVAQDLELLCYSFTRFGKNFPKSAKISPDSFIQLAFALAFYRIHGAFAPSYETATLRKFDEGRTENIRSPNLQMAKFVKMMTEGNCPFTELHEQLYAAVAAHKNYTVQCMDGAGMDRHLLAWSLLASENKLPAPSLLESPVFQRMKHFQISTSQVPTRHFIQMCFGPSEDDCYGICYNPQEKEFHFTISTFRHFPSTSSKRFAKELEKALNDLRAICVKGDNQRAKL